MKFNRTAVFAAIGFILAVIALTTFLTQRLFTRTTQETETSQFGLMRSIVQFNLQGAENNALARAELVASMPKVRELFAARKREALYAEMQGAFAGQKEKFEVDQSQFHAPGSIAFLRLNAPERHGDDLSAFRPIVVAVQADRVARKGLSISRAGPGIFGVVPVVHDGKFAGTFEFGSDFKPLLERLKKAYGLELSLFIDEARLKAAAPDLPKELFAEGNRLGRFVRFTTTNAEVMKQLVSDVELSSPGIENEPYSRDAGEVPYGVVLVPLTNPAGDKLGFVVAARDFSATKAALRESLVWLAVLSFLGASILVAVVAYVFHKGVALPLKLLNERFAALTGGGAKGEPVDPKKADGYYGEVGKLAHHYDRMRHVV